MVETPRTFALRILQSSWGIAIDLRAQWRISSIEPSLVKAGPRTYLDTSRLSLGASDIDQMLIGLAVVAAPIEDQYTYGYLIVEVLLVEYTATDYQLEGMVAAMIGWAVEEFEIDPPEIHVSFNRDMNRYEFTFEGLG